MGFLDKIKEFFKKFKEENKGFATTLKRINSPRYCGNINRGVRNGDFWEGSYVSLENGKGVIYGSNQPDYYFSGEDVQSFDVDENKKCEVSVGDKKLVGIRCTIIFKDGKSAQADILVAMLGKFRTALNI